MFEVENKVHFKLIKHKGETAYDEGNFIFNFICTWMESTSTKNSSNEVSR